MNHSQTGSPKTVDQLLEEARASLPGRVSPAEAAKALEDGALVIDIRSDDQRRADGLIPGATVVPRNSLEWRCDPTSPWRHAEIRGHDQRLILICNEGYQSSLAAATLQELGMHRATDVEGGFCAWKEAGLPVVRPVDAEQMTGNPPPPGAQWDGIYARTGATAVSWFQREPSTSLELIDQLQVSPESAVLDVGGGASALICALARRGYRDLTVVDVSERALAACRERLGSAAMDVQFIPQDVLTWQPQRLYDLWHDRAMFHFFVDPAQRSLYLDVLRSALQVGGRAIIGVFAEDGPEHCSGLPVMRYSSKRLAALVGEGFELEAERREWHTTPAGVSQPFQWVALLRR